MGIMGKKLTRECIAEVVGTFILVFFGCGSVAVDVIGGVGLGLFQVAMIWGLGVSLAIYSTGAISGAHFNPAVTIAIAVYRKKEFPGGKVFPYILSQLLGAFISAALLFFIFQNVIAEFEVSHNITRGEAGSQFSAMMFGEYFPNPAIFGTDEKVFSLVPGTIAFICEFIGTALLLFFIFALTDKNNKLAPSGGSNIFALFIGLTVTIIICIFAPFTQAALNPARDFGPRLFSFIAGWDDIAIPGPRSGFSIYILAPIAGGLFGAGVYSTLAIKKDPLRS